MGSFKQRHIKKPQGFEAWFFVIVVLLAFALFFLVLNNAWGRVSTELSSTLQEASPDSNVDVIINNTITKTTNAGLQFDKLIPLIVIGLFAFILISAGAIVKHPVMIVVGIIVLGVVFTIATVYSNIYNDISSSSAFSNTKADLPIQDKFMQYLPSIVILMAVGITIAMIWSRSNSGGAL
jgi:hypothetical protein